MNRRSCFFIFFLIPFLAFGQEESTIPLPKPQTDGGKPLMRVLKERKSIREFSTEKLPLQILSNLLWAGFGINRPDDQKRTAPSARNWQEIDIYVTTEDGFFLFDAKAHALKKLSKKDIRGSTGSQPFVTIAPVNLVYVADLSKLEGASDIDKNFYSAIDAGFIAENVYLFCASEGLGVVVRGMVPRDELAKEMKLRPDQKIIVAQTVGYPKK
ncbi:MAG: nitroreductase family protein [Bacteroidota bacterium]